MVLGREYGTLGTFELHHFKNLNIKQVAFVAGIVSGISSNAVLLYLSNVAGLWFLFPALFIASITRYTFFRGLRYNQIRAVDLELFILVSFEVMLLIFISLPYLVDSKIQHRNEPHEAAKHNGVMGFCNHHVAKIFSVVFILNTICIYIICELRAYMQKSEGDSPYGIHGGFGYDSKLLKKKAPALDLMKADMFGHTTIGIGVPASNI